MLMILSPPQFLAFVAGNRTICLSELVNDGASFEPRAYLVGHKDPVAAMAHHPDGELLVSVSSEGIFLWEVDALPAAPDATPAEIAHGTAAAAAPSTGMVEPFKRFGINDSREAHEAAVECCTWLAGGTCLATGGRAGAVKLWDTEEAFTYIDTLHAHKAAVLAIESCPGSDTLATAGRDSTIFLWDIRPLSAENRSKRLEDASFKVNQLFRIDGHRGDIVSLAFSKLGDVLYSGARDNEIKVWNISSAREMSSIVMHKGDVTSLVLMNGDKVLLSAAADGTVRLWDMSHVPELLKVTETFVAEDVSDLLDTDAQITDPASVRPELIMTCPAHERDVQAMAVNPKLPIMATSSSQSCVRLWNIRDLAAPQLTLEFVGHDAAVTSVAFVHGGQHFLSAAADYNVYLYDTARVRRITALACAGSVHCIALSALEDIVYAGSTDYAIRAFDIAPGRDTTFKVVAQLEGHAGKVSTMVVSRDGEWLFSAGYDFDIMVWPLTAVRGGQA
jgi:WD40 repeat protein